MKKLRSKQLSTGVTLSWGRAGGTTRSPFSQAKVLPWHKVQKGKYPLGKGGSVPFCGRYCYPIQLR